MQLGEIDGKIINPVKLKEQCALITQNYDYQNASYILLSDRVNLLCQESGLKGNAITGFKFQMSNYKSVFDALCYANELDKHDINMLNEILDSELGSDILDGTEILYNIKQAEADYERYLWQRGYWYSEYLNAEAYKVIYIDLCYYTYKHYENLADDAVEDKMYWEKRGELLLDIAARLSGLFVNGNEFRDHANKGINQIATAFNTDTNTYTVGDASWKDELLSFIGDSVYKETGEINWNLVKQILSKDADFISDTEYMLAAYAYMNADENEMNEFFMMCAVPEDVDRLEWVKLFNACKVDNLTFGNNCILTLDSAKIDGICRQANVYQTNLLAMRRYGNLDDASEDALKAERDNIIQRITMAQTLNEIHSFYGSRDENDFFDFEYFNENSSSAADLRVTYNSLMYATNASMASLDSHTVIVRKTLTSSGILAVLTNELSELEIKELTSYSTAIVGENIGAEVVDAVLEGIPGSGFAIFGMGLMEDIYKNEKKYVFLSDINDIRQIMSVSVYFDCCGNIVLYDDNKVALSIYEDKETARLAEAIGDLMGNSNLDSKYLLEHPLEVFQECLDYILENGDDEIHEIINGD